MKQAFRLITFYEWWGREARLRSGSIDFGRPLVVANIWHYHPKLYLIYNRYVTEAVRLVQGRIMYR